MILGAVDVEECTALSFVFLSTPPLSEGVFFLKTFAKQKAKTWGQFFPTEKRKIGEGKTRFLREHVAVHPSTSRPVKSRVGSEKG